MTESTIHPYKAEELLTLRRVDDDDDDSSQVMTVKIRKLQQPWTLSCGMVVDMLGSSPGSINDGAAAQQTVFFLKLYDWRFATQLRDDGGIEPWTEESGNEYAEMVMRDEADGFVEKLISDKDFREATEEGWDAGQNEASLAHEMLTMYRAETSVYERLADIQGRMVPHFLGAVEIDITPDGIITLNERQRRHFRVKGIMLEYIPGFSLSDLVVSGVPPGAWQGIVDRAIRIVHALSDRDVLNKDVRPTNFIASGWSGDDGDNDQAIEEFRIFMIDFGQSRLRREDEADPEWGRAKWRQDEEGAVGLVMQRRLKKVGIGISYVPSHRYLEFAEGEE